MSDFNIVFSELREKTEKISVIGIPRSAMLHFIALGRCCIFSNGKILDCDNPASSKSVGAISFRQHFLPLCICLMLSCSVMSNSVTVWTVAC